MTSTRSRNMQKRRDRILAEARKIIAERGFDAFNLRDLAEMSGLSVPTVYNLIGNKDEILKALILGTFADFEILLGELPPIPAQKLPERITKIFLELVSRDEEYFRSTVLAAEHIEYSNKAFGRQGVVWTTRANIADNLCRNALAEKLLRGKIKREVLVTQMGAAFQHAFREWAHRIISLQELRKASLKSFYVALAADAVDSYRDEIVRELKRL